MRDDQQRVFRAEAGDPEKLAAREAEYKARFANPFVAASRGYIDDVIDPRETRARLVSAFDMLRPAGRLARSPQGLGRSRWLSQ